tara:strand:- start:1236 stop:1667 length:432 start_codon:yes stop_codon:yes gene_type:complete
MVNNLLANPKKKKELNEKQKVFVDALVTNGGNISSALQEAGYSESSRTHLMRTLSEEIIERAQSVLAVNSVRAATNLVNAMDDDGSLPRSDVRLKAAESVLNRVGVGRRDTVEHNVTALHGVVLLPSKASQKKPVIIDNGEVV